MPALERWLRAGKQRIEGDVDANNLHAQMRLYGNEVAKLITNPNLTGQLTNQARKEVEEFLAPGASSQQIRGLVGLLNGDAGFRKDEIENQMKAIQNRLDTRLGRKPAADAGGWKIEEVTTPKAPRT